MITNSFTSIMYSGKCVLVNLFSYSTRGVPGIEIIGLGARGKLLKEKLIFLVKKMKIRFPPRRYVLGIELPEAITKIEELSDLELPLFILLLKLAGVLSFHRMDDCVCAGRINITGLVEEAVRNRAQIAELISDAKSQGLVKLKFITQGADRSFGDREESDIIDLKEIFEWSTFIWFRSRQAASNAPQLNFNNR